MQSTQENGNRQKDPQTSKVKANIPHQCPALDRQVCKYMESIQGCMVQHFHSRILWLVILNQCTHAQVKFKCWLVWLSSLETFPQKSNQYKMINNKIILNIFTVQYSTNKFYLFLALSHDFQCADPGSECHWLQSQQFTTDREDTPSPATAAPTRMLSGWPSKPEAQVGRKHQPHTCSAC